MERRPPCKVTRECERNRYTPPRLQKGCRRVPEGALIRLDREVYRLVSGMSGWRSRIVSQLKEDGCEMNVYEPCIFSNFYGHRGTSGRLRHDRTWRIRRPRDARGGRSLDGWPGKAHHESTGRLRQRIKFGKWHWLLQDKPSFFGGRHFTQLPDRSFKVDMTRFFQERSITVQRRRCLDKSAEASEGEVKALRAAAGSRVG